MRQLKLVPCILSYIQIASKLIAVKHIFSTVIGYFIEPEKSYGTLIHLQVVTSSAALLFFWKRPYYFNIRVIVVFES